VTRADQIRQRRVEARAAAKRRSNQTTVERGAQEEAQ